MRRVDRLLAVLGLACCCTLGTPAASAAEDKAAIRDALRQMREETLDQLYKEVPHARTQVRSAAGYGVFGAAGVHILFVGGSGGRGVVRDNLNGRDTYMRMSAVAGGLGIGFEDTRTVLIFKKRAVLKEFLDKGWTFGGETAATATVEGKGGATGELESPQGITIYQFTKTGLMAKGSVQGTKYWKDDPLN
ncbi:MAG: YSC84-related protein [Candidatus Contendobacter sp.]|nr:YSC84-related protein [Candidatus Contendobacter sp.]